MFGQNNQQPNDQIPEHSIQGALQSDDATTMPPTPPTPPTVVPPTIPAANASGGWGHPGVPLDAPQDAAPSAPAVPSDAPADVSQAGDHQAAPANDELIDIKQKALTQLSPLVGQLDQSPEEKFRTTMMMIQATDDQSLIPQAYEAANAIQDEKAKAQALLDIVNEINYFTSHHQG